jgi:tellurite resistance protein
MMPLVPASFFSMVLGLAGLGAVWRRAHQAWDLPAAIGEIIYAVAAVVWALLMVSYVAKWFSARTDAVEETRHPVQCCFIGLIGVATMLVAGGVLPYSHAGALALFVPGMVFTLAFAIWRTGILWQGERDETATSAVLYLPTVAGCFVTATLLAALGYGEWGQLAFGAGAFSWLAIESVLLRRLYHSPAMLPALRPTLGVQLAPPVVGGVAYLAITQGPPDVLVHALLGYGLLQTLLLLRLMGWIAGKAFVPGYWAFSFGVTAIAQMPLIMLARGGAGPAAVLAPILFVGANAALAILFVGTLWLTLRGKLLPPATLR